MLRREENDCADKLRKRQSVCVICAHGMIIRITPLWEEILLTGVSNADEMGLNPFQNMDTGKCVFEKVIQNG